MTIELMEAVGAQLTADRVAMDQDAHLGAGSFADVYQGIYKFPGRRPQSVALKVFRGSHMLRQSDTLFQQILAEVRIGQNLHHGNLVQLYGVVNIPRHGLALVMQLGGGGSVRDALSSSSQITWIQRVQWLAQIADGLSYLHALLPEAVVHRDVKAANVLLNEDRTVAMLADFGLAETMASVSGPMYDSVWCVDLTVCVHRLKTIR